MRAYFLSVAAYMLVTFGIQAANHFVINKAHYARQSIIAAEPALLGGIASTLIQGGVLTFLYSRLQPQFSDLLGGLGFALLMGLFLGSYIALGEASKYVVGSRLAWFAVEAPASLVQFALAGLALRFIHRNWGAH